MSRGGIGALRTLARLRGVHVAYTDMTGNKHIAQRESLLAVLRALGEPLDSAADAPAALRRVQEAEQQHLIPPVIVDRTGAQTSVTLPAAAVQYGARGPYLFLVDKDQKAVVRDITLGPGNGTIQAIAKGLEPGERVVLEGLDRLREGRPVVVVEGESAPKPPQHQK